MAKKVKKVDTKVKKKKWFTLLSPKSFGEQEIGETTADDGNAVAGRKVKVNVMSITGDPKKQAYSLTFEVTSVAESTASTQCVGYEMNQSNVRRIVRRNRSRIDDSFECSTADKRKIRIKPFIMTRFNTSKPVATEIRKLVAAELEQAILATSFENLIKDVLTGKVQMKIREKAKKVYPVQVLEIRRIVLLSSATDMGVEVVAQPELAEPVSDDTVADDIAADDEPAAEPVESEESQR